MIQKNKVSVASLFLVIGLFSFASITRAQTPSSTPPPTVVTGAAVITSATAANLSGNVTNTGGVPTVSRRGIKYGPAGLTVNGNPVYNNLVCSDGSFSAGSYTLSTGGTCGGTTAAILDCGQSYQYVAFATNAYGTNEGAQGTFSTQACVSASPTPQPPTLNVPTVSSPTASSATLVGYIASSVGSQITERGFNYGPVNQANPSSISYTFTVQDTGTYDIGLYTKPISDLTCGIQYNYRSFARNNSGRTDGGNRTFSTAACPSTPTPTAVTILKPTINAPTVTVITQTTATVSSNVTANGGENLSLRGFNLGLNTNYGTNLIDNSGPYSTGAFSRNLTGLICGTRYHIRATGTNSAGTTDTADVTFDTSACTTNQPTPTTVAVVKPSINVPSVVSITQTSAVLNSNVSDTGGENLSMRGFRFGTTASYGTNYISNGSFGTGSFSKFFVGLTCDTPYHVQATGANSAGTTNTADVTFTTAACTTVAPTPTTSGANSPTLSNLAVSSITSSSAILNASLDLTGGADVTARGFQYGFVAYIYGTTTLQSPGPYPTGNFSTSITNLNCNTTYHYRAYGTNSVSTTYTPDETFTTLTCPTPTATPLPVPPTIAAIPTASNITRKTATLTSQIVSGNATERGFRYGWSSGNYGGTKKENAVSFNPGIFSLDISSLAPNTKHYVQAYAKNAGGEVTSNEITFTTLKSPGNLTGWAWSSTIGWLNLATIAINQTNGNFEGYALSPNIGYVKFDGLTNYPTVAGAAPGEPANVNFDTGEVKGWIRACAGTIGGETATHGPDCSQMTSRTDGWDGWIELAGLNHPSVTPEVVDAKNNVMSGLRMNLNTGVIGGMAWGGNIVGWLNFNAATSSNQTAFAATCSAVNLGNGKVRFIAQPSGGNASYTFNWNNTGYSATSVYERPIQVNAFSIPLEVKDTSQVAPIVLSCTYTPTPGITIGGGDPTNGPCYATPNTILVDQNATFQINGTVSPPSTYRFTWNTGLSPSPVTNNVPNTTDAYPAPLSRTGQSQTSVLITDVSNTTANGNNKTFNCGDFIVSARELKLNIGTNAGDIQNKIQNGNGAKELLIKAGNQFRVEWKNTLSMKSAANPNGYMCSKQIDNDPDGWDWSGNSADSNSLTSGTSDKDVGTYVMSINCTSDVLAPITDNVKLKVISSTVREI